MVPMLFSVFNNFRLRNYDVLDALSMKLIKNIQQFSLKEIAAIVTYCSNLNYVNNLLFEYVEREVLRKLKLDEGFKALIEAKIPAKQVEEEIETNEEDEMSFENVFEDVLSPKDLAKLIVAEEKSKKLPEPEGNTENSLAQTTEQDNGLEHQNYIDVSQIMVALCRLKVVRIELFEVLESYFIRNLHKATPKSFMHYSYAHSFLCTEILNKIQQNGKKKPNRRTLKNIK